MQKFGKFITPPQANASWNRLRVSLFPHSSWQNIYSSKIFFSLLACAACSRSLHIFSTIFKLGTVVAIPKPSSVFSGGTSCLILRYALDHYPARYLLLLYYSPPVSSLCGFQPLTESEHLSAVSLSPARSLSPVPSPGLTHCI